MKRKPSGAVVNTSPTSNTSSPPDVAQSPTSRSSNLKANVYKDYVQRVGSYPIKLKKKKSWSFKQEISYFLLSKDSKNKPLLYIGQSGSNYVLLSYNGKTDVVNNEPVESQRRVVVTERKGPVKKNNGLYYFLLFLFFIIFVFYCFILYIIYF